MLLLLIPLLLAAADDVDEEDNDDDTVCLKLQALVYDILPSTTAVFSYAIGSRKMSANEQFFVGGAQTVEVTNNSNKTRRVV